MNNQTFNGDKKVPMKSLLAKCERKFIDSNVAKFPVWIQGYHLTLMTLPLSIGLIVCGYLAMNNLNWLWLSSLMLFLQWFTDSFDGALGRYRDTGIPKWGFYMDHFLDFVFMSSLFLSYSFLFEGLNKVLVFFMVPVFGCFMVSSFLAFGATGEFKITYLRTGPTEIRICFIILNCLITIFRTGFIEKAMIYIFVIFTTALCIVIYRTQKYIWNVDMQNKKVIES
ncbi:MAG TPA: CDP-alcohol phosphatidyltransferase family protein [Sedimentisphaerales bacterium]|nr:CDP-alcohol phosphatidyltransferase family protein [Sedimentisphaerales bacterium]